MSRSAFAIVVAACLLSGCVTIPEPLRGEFSDLAPDQPSAGAERVRWGGRVIEVLPAAEQTCLEILGMPLDSSARPFDLDADIGRFRACKSGFLDPAVFISGREVTVIGAIEAQVERQIGEYNYRMPQVRVETLFLWPPRLDIERIEIYSDPFPYFGVYPWWPGPYYYH
ncbi:MAG TPA: Slp family lipoprotein [Xanthomonadales bacterium]|nr:Slp family lipoprotein [Xanthomonadales bacterium]